MCLVRIAGYFLNVSFNNNNNQTLFIHRQTGTAATFTGVYKHHDKSNPFIVETKVTIIIIITK